MTTPPGARRDAIKRDPAADLDRVRRSVNPEAYWRERAEVAERALAAVRAGVTEFLDGDWRDLRSFVRVETGHLPTMNAMAREEGHLRTLLAGAEGGGEDG